MGGEQLRAAALSVEWRDEAAGFCCALCLSGFCSERLSDERMKEPVAAARYCLAGSVSDGEMDEGLSEGRLQQEGVSRRAAAEG